MLDARRPGTFLNFGAGVATAGLLFDRLGWQVTCADVSVPLLQFAKWRVKDRGVAIRVIDLHDERLPEDAFDVICAVKRWRTCGTRSKRSRNFAEPFDRVVS
jgi:cyclopropane fatty-acyl-phospholipid synthase-like methyltransferase